MPSSFVPMKDTDRPPQRRAHPAAMTWISRNGCIYRRNVDAGYNALTYDLRNFGHSGAANGGIASSGIFEARDVVGSLAYAGSGRDTRDMTIGLFSRCLGCSSSSTSSPPASKPSGSAAAPTPLPTSGRQ